MGNRKPAKMILVIAMVIAMVIALMMGARPAFERILGFALGYALAKSDSGACNSENIMTIPDLAGAKVEVVDTECDGVAKEEEVCVYFSRADVKGESWFARWRSHRTLVFGYDPGGVAFADMPLPSITHPAPSTILISIPKACDVEYESRKWENMSINYAIGNVH